jgi:type II secretory pathway predicted ATPase ExeA
LLAPDQLEELRLLTNARWILRGRSRCYWSASRRSRVNCGLVFAALDQRIDTRDQLAPMDLAKRLSAADTTWRSSIAAVLCCDAVARLHKLSLGLPGALNNAAIAALIAAAARARRRVVLHGPESA